MFVSKRDSDFEFSGSGLSGKGHGVDAVQNMVGRDDTSDAEQVSADPVDAPGILKHT